MICPELWNTFKYLRLRRNHYAHIAQALSPVFTGFLGTQGAQLNQFWRDPSRMGVAVPLDFSSQVIFTPTVGEVSAMLRIHLLWILHFDPLIVAQLNQTKVLSKYAEGLWQAAGGKKFKKNDATVENLARAIRTDLRQKTGGSPSIAVIEKLIWRFRE